ncbi:hypothetical protein KY290_007906 [Solanum tuberosum]|uniref:Uncharacterized protein n=1 Tax=Solanum tuberosum TaxID=4113 RepID=A0ABQ7W7C5_SOLTU|nr:hypothetical protein KY290_007906 [Solanum tuberosum]
MVSIFPHSSPPIFLLMLMRIGRAILMIIAQYQVTLSFSAQHQFLGALISNQLSIAPPLAKYREVASALSETKWITHLLKDLHMPLTAVPTILCDNLGVTYIPENPVHHTKMKHLEVDLHFVRNQVHNCLVQVSHVHSADQIADPLAKSLSKTAFQCMLPKLRVVSSHIT